MRLRPEGASMMARGRHAPVTLGSPRFRHIHAPSIDVVAAWFPPHGQLESHTHARAVFGVMLDGDFRTRILSRDVNYLASGAWTEPAEERHANAAGDRGAHVVVLQPSVSDTELAHECRRLLDEVVYLQSAELRADAARLAGECARDAGTSGPAIPIAAPPRSRTALAHDGGRLPPRPPPRADRPGRACPERRRASLAAR